MHTIGPGSPCGDPGFIYRDMGPVYLVGDNVARSLRNVPLGSPE